jgi:hypothetical protein
MSLRMGDYALLQEVGLALGDPYYVDDMAAPYRSPMMVPRPQYMPGMQPARPPAYGAQMLPVQRLVPRIPGAPSVGLRMQPMGFPTITFGAATGTALPSTSRPQRPFKGKRLLIDIARTGATSTGLVTVTSLNIGTNNQFVSNNPIGAQSFAGNAFDVNLELAACSTALDITIGLAISAAPTMTDTVAVQPTIIGEAIG